LQKPQQPQHKHEQKQTYFTDEKTTIYIQINKSNPDTKSIESIAAAVKKQNKFQLQFAADNTAKKKKQKKLQTSQEVAEKHNLLQKNPEDEEAKKYNSLQKI